MKTAEKIKTKKFNYNKTINLFDKSIKSKKLKNDINIFKENNRKKIILDNINNYIKKIVIKIIILLNIYSQIKNSKLYCFIFQYSKIFLKIRGIGENSILGDIFDKSNYPNVIKINEIKQNITNYKYFFNQTDNFVELIWDNDINNCDNLFYKCTNITEINLSDFNSSHVKSMKSMFYSLTLISLDFSSNFNTSLVTNMYNMFSSCSSLISLNLSNFDT